MRKDILLLENFESAIFKEGLNKKLKTNVVSIYYYESNYHILGVYVDVRGRNICYFN